MNLYMPLSSWPKNQPQVPQTIKHTDAQYGTQQTFPPKNQMSSEH